MTFSPTVMNGFIQPMLPMTMVYKLSCNMFEEVTRDLKTMKLAKLAGKVSSHAYDYNKGPISKPASQPVLK